MRLYASYRAGSGSVCSKTKMVVGHAKTSWSRSVRKCFSPLFKTLDLSTLTHRFETWYLMVFPLQGERYLGTPDPPECERSVHKYIKTNWKSTFHTWRGHAWNLGFCQHFSWSSATAPSKTNTPITLWGRPLQNWLPLSHFSSKILQNLQKSSKII